MEESHTTIPSKKPFSMGRFLKRFIVTVILSCFSIIGISILLVYLYEDKVKSFIIKELNKHLNAEVRIDPKNIDLTILKSFPNCALEFKDLTAMEVTKTKTKDTLLFARRLALDFNIQDLFNKNYTIKKIELEHARALLKIDKSGNPNYLIWKTENTAATSDSLSFALEKIQVKDVKLNYKNSRAKIKLNTHIKDLNFKGKFNNDQYLLVAEGSAFVDLFQVEKMKYLENKNLKLNIELDVNENTYTIKRSETFINATQLISNGAFVVNDSLISLDIKFEGSKLDISSTLSLLPEKFQSQINDYKSDGEFYAKGAIHYQQGKTLFVNSEFGIKNATITYKPKTTTLSNVNLLGSLDINEKQSVLKLREITANLNSNTFTGEVELSHFENPYLKLKVAARTKLEELISFYPIDTLQEVSGSIDVQAELQGLISDLKVNVYNPNIKANGEVTLTDLKAKFKNSDRIINIPEGQLRLDGRRLNVLGLKIIKGKSDILLVGEMPNFLSYLFDSRMSLIVNANVRSEYIDVDDFLFGSHASSSSAVFISDKLDFTVSTTIKRLSFGTFSADDITGSLALKDQKIAVKDFSLTATDGAIVTNAFIDASGEHIKVSGDCDLTKLNIRKLFTQLNNFGQNTLQDKHLKGFVTAHVDFTAAWDRQLQVDLNSINATSSILVEKGELIGFKPLESLAKYIEMIELKHIKFSTLQSAVEIKNRMITFPKTSIKSSAINLELWGNHNFDNIIEYHIQLLLSDINAKRPKANKNFDDELSFVENDSENRRSVFILMKGPMDNPEIKYDKKGAKEKIKQDIKQEKQNLKQILQEEFGFFKKDSISKKQAQQAGQKFQIKIEGEDSKKKDKTLQPKKREEENDDF